MSEKKKNTPYNKYGISIGFYTVQIQDRLNEK